MNPAVSRGSGGVTGACGRRRSRRRLAVRIAGITLLEVLVALSILAVALGALVKAGTQATRNTAHVQERLQGHWVGQNLLAQYEAGLQPPVAGTREGRVEQGDRLWAYQVNIDWVQPGSIVELPPVLRVDIEVWPESSEGRALRSRVQGYLLP